MKNLSIQRHRTSIAHAGFPWFVLHTTAVTFRGRMLRRYIWAGPLRITVAG